MPILPWLTDREEDLDALARGARDAGAEWLGARVLYLMPDSWKTFLAFLAQKFPRLVTRYREWYGRNADAPENYRKETLARIERLRRKCDLGARPETPVARSWQSPQMLLALGKGEQECRT
jgi:DNA repair photolyase